MWLYGGVRNFFKTSDWIRHQLLALVLVMSPRSLIGWPTVQPIEHSRTIRGCVYLYSFSFLLAAYVHWSGHWLTT